MEDTTTISGAAFADKYSTIMRSIQRQVLVAAVVSLVVSIVHLAVTIDPQPAWLKQAPCTFQTAEVKDQVTAVSKPTNLIMMLAGLGPAAILIVAIGMNACAGQLGTPRRFPFKTMAVSWLWYVIVLLGTFSFINVKELTRYSTITSKSCKVGLSTLFFPKVGQSKLLQDETARFRRQSGQHFSNRLNHLEPDELPGLESTLKTIDIGDITKFTDDTESCDLSSDAAKNPIFSKLYNHTTPNAAIEDYCEMATEETTTGGKDPGWPVDFIAEQVGNIIDSLALAELACDVTASPNWGISPSPRRFLTADRVCASFKLGSWDKVPVDHRPYLGSAWKLFGSTEEEAFAAVYTGMRDAGIMDDPADLEAACLFLGVLDPQTGVNVLTSKLCPALIADVTAYAPSAPDASFYVYHRNMAGLSHEQTLARIDGYRDTMFRDALLQTQKYGSLLPNDASVVTKHINNVIDAGMVDAFLDVFKEDDNGIGKVRVALHSPLFNHPCQSFAARKCMSLTHSRPRCRRAGTHASRQSSADEGSQHDPSYRCSDATRGPRQSSAEDCKRRQLRRIDPGAADVQAYPVRGLCVRRQPHRAAAPRAAMRPDERCLQHHLSERLHPRVHVHGRIFWPSLSLQWVHFRATHKCSNPSAFSAQCTTEIAALCVLQAHLCPVLRLRYAWRLQQPQLGRVLPVTAVLWQVHPGRHRHR